MNYLGFGTLFVSLAAIATFILTLMIVRRGKGPMAGTALVLLLPLPTLVCVACAFKGIIASMDVISTGRAEVPSTQEFAGALGVMFMDLSFSMVSTVPSYLLAIFFLLRQSLQVDPNPTAPNEV